MNLLTDNAPLLLSIGIALATGMIVVFGGSLLNTYWSRYTEKLSVEKQLQEQMASDYEDPRKNKSTLWFKWNKYWEKRLINSGVNFMAANRENAGRMVIYIDLAAVAIFAVIFRGSLLASIIIVIAADIIMSFVLGFMADKRLEKLTRQLPAFVSALKSADARSKDASTTLQMAIATTPDELHNELKPVEEQLQAGGQLKPVLTGFYDQTSIEDLRFTMGCIMKDVVFPGMVGYQVKVMMAIDTSASVTGYDDQLSLICKNAEEIMKAVMRNNKHGFSCFCVDTTIKPERIMTSIDDLDLTGGGGTDMAPAFEYVNGMKGRNRPDIFVLASDGEFDWNKCLPYWPDNMKVIILITSPRQFVDGKPSTIPDWVMGKADVIDVSTRERA